MLKIFRDLLTAQYIYATHLRRPTSPRLSIWNLVYDLRPGTLSQNAGAWGSRPTKRGSRPFTIIPWSYNRRNTWNNYVVSPLSVVRGSRSAKQTSCLVVRCSSSRCSSASPSMGLCNVYALGKCVRTWDSKVCTQKLIAYQSLTLMCTMCTHFSAVFRLLLQLLKNTVLFSKKNINLKTPCTHRTHLYSPRVYSLYTLLKCVHMCVHSAYTWGSNAYTLRI